MRAFPLPYSFYGPDEYGLWLPQAGFRAKRAELIPKQMRQQGREALAGWIRTTWLPYTERILEQLRERFVNEVVDRYVDARPPDAHGIVQVQMVRLEVEAVCA